MTDQPQQGAGDEQRPMTEEELRNLSPEELQQLYQQEMEQRLSQVRVEEVVAEALVTLINLGGRRAGLAPGAEGERDLDQLRLAIDGASALHGVLSGRLGPEAAPVEQALSELRMAYVRLTGSDPNAPGAQGGDGAGSGPAGDSPGAGGQQGPGPAQSSGRLWVPGQ